MASLTDGISPSNPVASIPRAPLAEKAELKGRSITPLSPKEQAKVNIESLAREGESVISAYSSLQGDWKAQAGSIKDLSQVLRKEASKTHAETAGLLKEMKATRLQTAKNASTKIARRSTGRVRIKMSSTQKSLVRRLKQERKTASRTLKALNSKTFKAQIDKNLNKMRKLRREMIARTQTSGFLAAVQRRGRALKTGKAEQKALKAQTRLRTLATQTRAKAISHGKTLSKVQQETSASAAALKSQFKTLTHLESDIRRIDQQMHDLSKIRENIPLVHATESGFKERLSRDSEQILTQLGQYKLHLEALKTAIATSAKETAAVDLPLEARKQALAYEFLQRGAQFAIDKLSVPFQESFQELPLRSPFAIVNLFIDVLHLQIPVGSEDKEAPYAAALKTLDKLNANLGATPEPTFAAMRPRPLGAYTTFIDSRTRRIEETADELADHLASIQKLPTPAALTAPLDSWTNKEQRQILYQLREIYTTEASYVSSLDKMIKKLENLPPELIADREGLEEYLTYARGLSSGAHLLLSRFDSFFQGKELTPENLKSELEQFFKELSQDQDLKDYLKLYASSNFMFQQFDSLATPAIRAHAEALQPGVPVQADDRLGNVAIMPVQRVMRYVLLLEPLAAAKDPNKMEMGALLSLCKTAAKAANTLDEEQF